MRGPLGQPTRLHRIWGDLLYLLYMDESGGAENVAEHHFVLGGVAVFERRTHWIARKLDKWAGVIGAEIGVAAEKIEFHASAIRAGKEAPWKTIHKGRRLEFLEEALKVLGKEGAGVCVMRCAVHKQSYVGDDPIEIAFEDVCSRFDKLLKRLHREGDTQRGLLIIDHTKSSKKLLRMANEFRTLGTRWGVLNNMAESPMFMDSKESRMLQLADLVANAVFRRYQYGDTRFFDLIAHKIDAAGARVHGISHKHTQLPHCRCLACTTRG